MKEMNAKELFELLYEEKISDEECIEVLHPEEKDHFLLRKGCLKKFDKYDLLGCLLFKEYKFAIKNQEEVEKYLEKRDKARKIERLEKELSKLKNSD